MIANRNSLRRLAACVAAGAAFAGASLTRCAAQDVVLNLHPGASQSRLAVPGFGAGLESLTVIGNGGQQISVVNGTPQLRPQPAQSSWSTSLEYQSWAGDGVRVAPGHSSMALLGYSRGLTPNDEVAITLPYQQIKIDGGILDQSGLGDTELAYRHSFYNPQQADGPTLTLSGKAYLPTGDFAKGTGAGEFGLGVSATASRPFGRTLGYAGAGYTAVGRPAGADTGNVFYVWAGGFTRLPGRWSVQYEAVHYNTLMSEGYTRLLAGVRYALTPSTGLQLNLARELQADGHPTIVSLGYSARM